MAYTAYPALADVDLEQANSRDVKTLESVFQERSVVERAMRRKGVHSCTIMTGDAGTDVGQISFLFKDADGNNITYPYVTTLINHLSDGSTLTKGQLATTGGSTGVEELLAPEGYIIATLTAKKVFLIMTTTTGSFSCKYTDITAAEVCALSVGLPDGSRIYAPPVKVTDP